MSNSKVSSENINTLRALVAWGFTKAEAIDFCIVLRDTVEKEWGRDYMIGEPITNERAEIILKNLRLN